MIMYLKRRKTMKKQERIEAAQKRIQELKKLIDYWLKNGKS